MAITNTYGDSRILLYCTFCGGETGTRDHCPSRVLLDEPYPNNLAVVPACRACNIGFSADEEYLACLISCVLAGSTDINSIARTKIKRILSDSPALRARLELGKSTTEQGVVFQPESDRVTSVIKKLAQGHALYELHEPCPRPPDVIGITPLISMSDAERLAFERPESSALWPEVGSRAMQRMVLTETDPESPWIVVQHGMYRFHASTDAGTSIQIVIQEYLACFVHWDY